MQSNFLRALTAWLVRGEGNHGISLGTGHEAFAVHSGSFRGCRLH
jgi:hypothetical protein